MIRRIKRWFRRKSDVSYTRINNVKPDISPEDREKLREIRKKSISRVGKSSEMTSIYHVPGVWDDIDKK